MTLDARQQRATEFVLFGVTFLTFAYFYQASDHSTAARFDLIRSILERRTMSIDGFCGYNTADIINFHGHYYSVKAPGASFTGLIPWMFWQRVLSFIDFKNEALYWAALTHLTIVFSTSLIVALTCVVIFSFAQWLGATQGRALAVALTMALGTIIFPYATEMTGEPIAGACGICAFYLLCTRDRREWFAAGIAGALSGWAVLNDYPAIIIAVPLAIYALYRFGLGLSLVTFAIGAAAVALLLLAYNRAAFGNWFFFSYQAFKQIPGNEAFPEQAVGFVGLTYPKPYVLWKILLDPQRGLFFCNPVLLLSIPGLIYLWRSQTNSVIPSVVDGSRAGRRDSLRPEFIVVATVVIGFILFNASYGESIVSWGGGTATGPRQLAAAIPFMVLPLALLPASYNWLLGATAALSCFLMLSATAVEPHLPYEYQNPLRDFVLPAYLRGDLAYNKNGYFGGAPIAGDSVAFNIGKLVGLPPSLQLWPLAFIWIAAAIELTDRTRELARNSLAPVAAIAAVVVLFAPPSIGSLIAMAGARSPHGLLGRYYEGMTPGPYPPHIVRVDRSIDFSNLAELGALPYPSVAVWSGSIVIAREGEYAFSISADDNGWIRIDGRDVIADVGELMKPEASGTISLSAGTHQIEIGERNIVGDASVHVEWQPPDAPPQPLPTSVLVPSPP